MKLSVATNWDPDLPEVLSPFPIYELFGALAASPVGGGRPSFLLAPVSQECVAEHVRAAHARGWSFNYLLNAPCMDNMEFEPETHRQLIEHLAWLRDIGVDTVTVSIPYLLELVKRQFPELRVKVSAIAHVGSVARAQLFESLGADEITIDYMSNREFAFLRKVRTAVRCDLTLLANDLCLYQCPYRTYHYNLCGHASQTWHPTKGFYVDYCIVSCSMQKLSEPEQLIRARWIRPEDVARYEALGFEKFKLGGRRMSTAWLVRAAAAYTARSYPGNLMDLLDGATPGVDPDMRSPQYAMLLSGAELLKSEKLLALGQFFPVKPIIDNGALDGFLDSFASRDCLSGCGGCSYCRFVADRAVHVDEQEVRRYVSALSELKDDLVTSRLFRRENGRRDASPEPAEAPAGTTAVGWDPGTRSDFERLIGRVPQNLRPIAQQIVGQVSEQMATERGARAVERRDMVAAFLAHTPVPFRADMLRGLAELGIDPGDYGGALDGGAAG